MLRRNTWLGWCNHNHVQVLQEPDVTVTWRDTLLGCVLAYIAMLPDAPTAA
jgi:hypothetical protein